MSQVTSIYNQISAYVLSNVILKTSMMVLFISALAIYFVGFSELPIAHNTFHEIRHALELPCH